MGRGQVFTALIFILSGLCLCQRGTTEPAGPLGNHTPKFFEELDAFDTYSYLLICPFGMLASLTLLGVHIFNKELRKPPGDLICMIALSEFVLGLHWFLSAYRTTLISTPYEDESFFCKLNSQLAITAATADTFYNIAFLAYIIIALRSAMKKKSKCSNYWIHGMTIFFIVIVRFFAKPGRTPYGTCSSKFTEGSLVTGTVMLTTMIFVSLFVYFYTERQLPKYGAEMSEIRKDFLNYYRSYLKAYMMTCGLVLLSYICQRVGDNQNDPDMSSHRTFKGVIFNIGKIGNTAKALMPLLLFFIRCQDPVVAKKVQRPFRRMTTQVGLLALHGFQALPKRVQEGLSPENRDADIYGSPSLDVSKNMVEEDGINMKEALENELMTEGEDQNWMNLLPVRVKETFTRTFIGTIMAIYPGLVISTMEDKVTVCDDDAKDARKYIINGEELMNCLETDESLSSCEFVVYAPKVFRDILMNCTKTINFEISLDIHMNKDRIKKAGENAGGASGELFLFSHDNQLIIKTITPEEYRVFTQILYSYEEYLKYSKTSQIAKIYGMFEFKFPGSEKPIRLVVMENIFTLPKECIMRKYDLKGSKFTRQVLKNHDGLDKFSTKSEVMKDLDFNQIEEGIDFLDKMQRLNVLAGIQRDVNFFETHNIIDYSLIVAAIDRTLCDETALMKEATQGSIHLIQSTEPRILYLIGIIDYFQLYTWGKAAERFYKRASRCDPSLQTSSQPPVTYSRRFYNYLASRFY
jgi:1-phosphatidylinositol-4-phosphate 5-kinase